MYIEIIIKGVLFSALLLYSAGTDIKRREVSDWVCAAILIVSLIGSGGSFWGAVLTALPYYIAAMLKTGRMGGGDVKLMGACGAVLGIWGGAAQSIIGLSLAGIYGLVLRITKGCKPNETPIPLAPFLCAGGIASFILMNMGGF